MENKRTKAGPGYRRGKRLPAIAAFALLTFAVWYLYRPVHLDRSYLQSFVLPVRQNLAGLMDSLESAQIPVEQHRDPQMLLSALTLYKKGQFSTAIPAFQHLIQKNPEDADAWFYLGNSQMQEGRFKDAVASFEAAIPKISVADSKYLEWQLALSLALQGRNDTDTRALALLTQITRDDLHPFQTQAKEVMELMATR